MADSNAIGFSLKIDDSQLKKLDEIDNKINKIATDSDNMAKVFTAAMTRMGGGADGLLQKLQAIQGAIDKLDISKFAQGIEAVGQGSTQVEQFASAIAKAAEAINKYNIENKKREDVDNSKQIELLNKEIEALKKRTQQLDEYIKKQQQANQGGGRTRGGGSSGINSDVKAMNAYNRAMASSEALVTQRINKIAKLRQAEEMLRNASGNYTTQLNRISQEIARLNKLNQGQVDSYGRVIRSQRQLVNTSEQLTRQLALVFSVSAIEGYIMKLIQVRGEFELQQTALASILQNKDQADQLFGQITELAVKSPFTLKELTTYTKSLAAYQVQYEDLYDTTKMLADVSAGLGVDMQRLILAFGQVKAANFLRGTEVRQFTEAGLNILGELAKYYSELEGRMISVGDVQEMVTNRMVSFGDVEEVFKRVTSAGGMFYNMQERQADTLAGMMSNLRDNIDLMFNDIGKSNDSVIKNMVKTLTDLIKNWQEVAWYVEKAAYAFVGYKSISALITLGNTKMAKSLFSIATQANNAGNAIKFLKSGLASLGRGLAVGGILAVVAVITELIRRATEAKRKSEELSKELSSLVSSDAGNLDKMVAGYEDLITRLKLANEGSQTRRDLISQLNQSYGEYIPFLVDETTTCEQLAGAYEQVVEQMKRKSAAQSLEKGYQAINQAYIDNLTDAKEEFENIFTNVVGGDIGRAYIQAPDDFFGRRIIPTEDDIDNIYKTLQQRIRESNDEQLQGLKNWEKQRQLVEDIMRKYYGSENIHFAFTQGATLDIIDSYIEKREKEKELEEEIEGIYENNYKTRDAYLALQQKQLEYEEKIRKIKNTEGGLSEFETGKAVEAAQKEFELNKIDILLKFGEISEEDYRKQKEAIENRLSPLTVSINTSLNKRLTDLGYGEEDIAKVLISEETQAAGTTAIIQQTKSAWEQQVAIMRQLAQLKSQGLDIDQQQFDNAVKMEELYRERANVLGIELDYMKRISEESFTDINKQMPEGYQLTDLDSIFSVIELQEKYNKKYNDAIKKQSTLNNQKSRGVDIDEAELTLINEQVAMYDKLRKLLGYAEDAKGKGSSDAEKRLRNQIELLKQAGKAYEDYRKLNNAATSQQKTMTDFAPALSSAGLSSSYIASLSFDVAGVISGIQGLFHTLGAEGQKIINEAVAPLQNEVEVEAKLANLDEIRKQVDDEFAKYEFSVQMQKEGMSARVISDALGIDVNNLEDLKEYKDSMVAILDEYGKEGESVMKEIESKITDIQEKELKERISRYAQSIKESVSERARIEVEAQQEMMKIRQTGGMSDEAKDAAISYVRQETDKKLNKLDWEEFQNSEVYTQMFADLEYVSTAAIKRAMANLDELRSSLSDLDPEQLKTINEYYSKMEEQLIARNPFAAMRDSMKEVNELRDAGRTEEYLNNELVVLEQGSQALALQISDLETIIYMKENGLSLDTLSGELLQRNAEYIGMETDELREQVAERKKSRSQIQSTMGIASKDLASYDKARKSLNSMSQEMDTIRQLGNTAFDSVMSILESMGVETDSTAGILAEMGNSLLDLAAQAVQFGIQLQLNTVLAEVMGVAINTALGPIGWAVMALQALVIIITAISQIHDNKRQQIIEAEQEKVEALSSSYENLYEKLESGLSTKMFSQNSDLVENMRRQIQSYQAMINAERDKKSTDEDQIKEWQDEMEELAEETADLYANLRDELVGDFKSMAEDLGQALVDAYKEGENAQKAWGEKVKDIMGEILLNLLVMRFIEPRLQEIVDSLFAQAMPKTAAAEQAQANALKYRQMINETTDEDLKKSYEQQAQAWERNYEVLNAEAAGEIPNLTKEVVNGTIGDLNDLVYLVENNDIAEMLKALYNSNAGDTLSGLQRGIQGVTEETAQVLSSILESIRYFVSDENQVIRQIYNTISMPSDENPFLSELQAQTEQLRLLYDLWNGVVNYNGSSGRAVNVRIV